MICVTWHMFPGLDLYSIDTDPAQHLETADTGCTVHDLDDLDHDRSEVWKPFIYHGSGRVGAGRVGPPWPNLGVE